MDGDEAEVVVDNTAAAAGTSARNAFTRGAADVDVRTLLPDLRRRRDELSHELQAGLAAVEQLRAEVDRENQAGLAAVERLLADVNEVRSALASAQREHDALINAPVSGGRDPFEWLPDELLVVIFSMLPLTTLCSGACERVCRRWAMLMKSPLVERRKPGDKWGAYAAGNLNQPRMLVSREFPVRFLATGPDGFICCSWSSRPSGGVTVMALTAPPPGANSLRRGRVFFDLPLVDRRVRSVHAISTGRNQNIYTGSADHMIRVWDGNNRGVHVGNLMGHTGEVLSLATGFDGKIYSGSSDRTIRVWQSDDGVLLYTLTGHSDSVVALAVSQDGTVYSGSSDHTIKVWSGEDGTEVRTLVGHTGSVTCLAVGHTGTVFSASNDGTIRVWQCSDGALLRTLAPPPFVNSDVVATIDLCRTHSLHLCEYNACCQ